MGDPFSLFNGLWASRQCHEVAFDNVLGVGVVEPERTWVGQVVVRKSITTWKTAG